MTSIKINHIAETLEAYLSENLYTSVAVLVDENTKKNCLPALENSLNQAHIIEIKSGEEYKTLATCEHIWSQMTSLKLDRNSLLINLGGGVIGDMGGFCAATYKRGIDFINIPTTLLAQVDASVGGKLGIDFNGFKNQIGLFKEPKDVFLDASFLKTLSKRELRSGFAEIIKHAIVADEKLWNKIKLKSFDELNFESITTEAVKIKGNIVAEDPLEQGKRKVLNYGHSIGHAVESHFLSTNKRLLHGEAVALGMISEAYVAGKKQLIKGSELEEIADYIIGIFGKVGLPEKEFDQVIELLAQDKKNRGNKILMALPTCMGKAKWDVEVSRKEVKDALKYYISL